ncbi:MAG: hypothetical protein K0R88_1145 [Solirubrobacterales bacterium]|jgi:hypothetical protein|nr:hypothetical protein [Solirubrobacterales bacterium]
MRPALDPNTVRRHLGKLAGGRLIESSRQGRAVKWTVTEAGFEEWTG